MRALIVAVVLVPAFANAQPGTVEPAATAPDLPPTSPEVFALARGAHAAGVRGDCVGARTLAARIERLDRDFHAAVITTDPSIAACKPRPRVYAMDPEVPPPGVAAAAARPAFASPPNDTGRNLIGQAFLGSVMGAGLGILGAVVGAGASDDEFSGVLLLGSVGLAAGTTAGVVLAGDNAGSDYSLGLTLAGSVAGTLLGWRIVFSSEGFDSPALALGVVVAAPTLGAMIGFNASRQTLAPTTSLRIAVPAAPRISDPTTSLPVISGSF